MGEETNIHLSSGSSNLLPALRNIKLVLEYDGTDFSGSQLQSGRRTVQGELEKALAQLTGLKNGERCPVSLAGRTDTGVHAAGQVASFKTESSHSLETYRRGLNALLPFDIAVLQTAEEEASFHARFSAKARVYRYTILNQVGRSPLARRFAHQVAGKLDVAAMQAASQKLLGEHDFASFAGAGWGVPAQEADSLETEADRQSDKRSTVRRLCQAEWRSSESLSSGNGLELELVGNAFLPHMVRNIVGTLLLVGKGELDPKGFEEILRARDRRRAGPTAPACGLCLVEVRY